jgi:hypothetical protein
MRKKMIFFWAAFCICLGLGVSRAKTGPGNAFHDPARIDQVSDPGVEWVRRYDGDGHASDFPNAIAVNSAGYVFVTGGSIGTSNEWDYATIMYTPDGKKKWVKRYDYNTSSGIASKLDMANAMALDSSGNIYVTGESSATNGVREFATIKYDGLGNRKWVARSNCEKNNSQSQALAIALDINTNVIVSGRNRCPSADGSSNYDFATIKYDGHGKQKWIRRFDGYSHKDDEPASIGVDFAGNIYVTGYTKNFYFGTDFHTIKYDPNGGVLWSKDYKGPNNSLDKARALKVANVSSGYFVFTKIFVMGYSKATGTGGDYATIKYDLDGNPAWVARFDGPTGLTNVEPVAMAVDGSGNVYVTGSGGCEGSAFITIKYDFNGNLQWVKTYDAGCSWDFAKAIAVDNQGNVYVTGQSEDGDGTSFDFATVKYDTNGHERWVRRYDGTGNDYEWPRAITVDNAGFVYVTGYSMGNGTKEDYLTIKYTAQ